MIVRTAYRLQKGTSAYGDITHSITEMAGQPGIIDRLFRQTIIADLEETSESPNFQGVKIRLKDIQSFSFQPEIIQVHLKLLLPDKTIGFGYIDNTEHAVLFQGQSPTDFKLYVCEDMREQREKLFNWFKNKQSIIMDEINAKSKMITIRSNLTPVTDYSAVQG
jgi:hypothetical protein